MRKQKNTYLTATQKHNNVAGEQGKNKYSTENITRMMIP